LRHLRVAMIDLDFRQRGLSRRFGLDAQPGMAEVLRGERRLAEVCLPFVRENLCLIPAGDPAGANPSELISAGHAAGVFKELNERFHYTLVDTPPVSTVADIGLVAPMCHSVILVIRMNRTPEPMLRRSVKLLQANHVSIAGCLLAGYDEATMGYADNHDYYGNG
jgi:Mrp family chromosome partitioning ATPase